MRVVELSRFPKTVTDFNAHIFTFVPNVFTDGRTNLFSNISTLINSVEACSTTKGLIDLEEDYHLHFYFGLFILF